jgi:3-oxoacid CoA-transferase B subunit
MADVRHRIASRAAQELRPGDVVNLGIGIPTLIGDVLRDASAILLHTENGMVGVGPAPTGEPDPSIVNAAKQPVTARPGAAYFDSALSFGMIRAGHVDVAVVGAIEVDERGILANWSLPGTAFGVGGAMDLLAGARRVIVTTLHTSADGAPKLVRRCRVPITSVRPVDVVVTELCVFRVVDGGLVLIELAEGTTLDDVASRTEATYEVALAC